MQLWFAWKIVLLQYHKQQLIKIYDKRPVVICLKNRTFAVSQTAFHEILNVFFGCDLLEKSYFCSITNSIGTCLTCCLSVVICLKNRTFAVSQTAVGNYKTNVDALWFAWKIVLLQYHKQLRIGRQYEWNVVICLKNRTFAVSQTAIRQQPMCSALLWFAWKIVLLQYHKQLTGKSAPTGAGCDLLEKSYFCSITNSITLTQNIITMVVICLKNRTFAVSQTANMSLTRLRLMLWFAWKIVLLQYHKQRERNATRRSRVVICLKNRTFAVSQTAVLRHSCVWNMLWFAWKIVLLQYHKQQEINRVLSDAVVICLKNRTFAVSQTARVGLDIALNSLWFAWKIVLLQYHKQPFFLFNPTPLSCDLLEKSYFCSITNSWMYGRKCFT